MVRSKLTFFVFPYSFLHTPGLIVTFKDQAREIWCKPLKFCFNICSESDKNFWCFGTHIHIAGVSVSHTDSLKDSLFLNVHLSFISFVCIIICLKNSYPYPKGRLPEKKTPFLGHCPGRRKKLPKLLARGGVGIWECPKVRVCISGKSSLTSSPLWALAVTSRVFEILLYSSTITFKKTNSDGIKVYRVSFIWHLMTTCKAYLCAVRSA